MIGIVLVAKYSQKVAFCVNQCITTVTYVFLILCYTLVTSTSLQLLRGIKYDDSDSVFVYLSPHLKYFTHQHALYATIALLCGLIIVIGLPVLLLIVPFLRKNNLVLKFQPMLNQFQDSYKDKYQWFAAYYFLCRLVIMLIAYFGNSDSSNMVYYLQTACVIMVIIQICFRPYKKHVLNVLDTIILLNMLLVVNLNNFNFTESTTVGLVYTLLFIPLLLLVGLGFAKPLNALKVKWQKFYATPMIGR